MRADEIHAIVAPVAGDDVVISDAGGATWTAWFVGGEARAHELRMKLRAKAPDVATSVMWIGVPRLPGADEVARLPALARSIGAAEPETGLERIVAVAWHEALGAAVTNIDEDFFAAGGHSLLAADVAARLKDILGVEVPLTMVLDRPTVREQAAWLAQASPPRPIGGPRGRPAIASAYSLTGVIDDDTIARGVQAIARRHGVASELARIDLSALPGPARRAAWQDALAELARGTFEAPWRAVLARCSPGHALFAAAFDGSRFDAVAARMWMRELADACGTAAPLWPERRLAAPAALATAPDVSAGWRAIRIPAARAGALVDVGRQQAAAPLATLVAAIAVLVARRTRSPDVVLAIPASLRGVEARGTLGAMTTTIAIAIDFSDEPTFLTVVERTSAAICRGWAAAAGVIAPPAALRPADASVELAASPDRFGGAIAWREAMRAGSASTSLAFALRFTARGLIAGRIGYDDHEINADEADALAEELDAVIAEVAADPARRARRTASADDPPPAETPSVSDPLPLTHAQERLWFVEDLSGGTTANHLQRIMRIEGPLDHAALLRSLEVLANRHDALRTVFRVVKSSPHQIVHASLPLEHTVDDLGGLTAEQCETAIAQRAAAEYERHFALGVGPLWRTRLIRQDDTHHRLVLTIHHLVIDALSLNVWHRELAEIYRATVSGTAPRLGRIGTSIARVAEWERSAAGRQRIVDDLAYWLDNLAGASPLELPIDYRRPPTHSLGRHEVNKLLPPDRTAEVRALGRRHGATLSVTLIAAAAAFLSRHTGQDDLVCVVPASRRDDPGRKAVIGLLLNLLPLRLRLDGDPTFGEIITRTTRALHEALAHSEAPFERIVANLGLAREPGRQPLFDVILNMVPGTERLWWGDVRVTIDTVIGSAQPCDLVIGAASRPGGFLNLVVRCRDDVFSADSARRLAERFQAMLLAAAESPSLRLSELPIVPPDERREMIETWNATAMPLPETTVHGMIAARASAMPDAIAVIQGERRLAYREVIEAAHRFARKLHDQGVAPGTRVGVLLPPSPELAIAALGVLEAGAIYVPLDAGQPAARLAQLQGEVAVTITTDAIGPEILGGDPVAPLVLPISPDAPAYIVFTSGSTGRPKGVSTTHRALINQLAWYARDLPWQAGEVAILRSSPAFVDAMWELFGPLADGVPLAIATAEEMLDPRLLASALDRYAVTRLVVVPSLLQTLLQLDAGHDVSLWLATSEELKPALVDAFYAARPGARLVNLYGASETADQTAAHEVRPGDRGPRTPIGKPIANTQLYVLDPAGRPVPIGVYGEICASGAGVSDSYLPGAPADAQAKFMKSPFSRARMYRSGDRGRWRHDGLLEYAGRLDHQLKIRGIRIDPAEVEAALLAHPAVVAAAVSAHPGFDGELRLAGFVVLRDDAKLDARELRRFLRTSLPETLIPTSFTQLSALPLGPTGKIDRRALPAPVETVIESRPPQGAVEHAVALAWEQLLGRPVGAEDDFFAVGGQSLIAAQLGARLGERFDVELPLGVLFERPTVAAQAAWLEDAAAAALLTAIPRAGAGPHPLSFAQERLWFAHSLSPRAPAPKLRFALRIEGPLDRERLAAAMRKVAERHDALRTVFVGAGSGARQQVLPDVVLEQRIDDLSAMPEVMREAALRTQFDEERELPFDLAAGPPWRTRLIKLEREVHALLLTIHHFVGDGISTQLMLDEIDATYTALGQGREPVLPAVAIGAADVAVWQRRMAASGFWDMSRKFWRETLAGMTPLDLPLVAPRKGWASSRTAVIREQLTADDVAALEKLARAEHTTTFSVLLAGVGAVLHAVTGRTDITVGTIAAGRDRPEVRQVVGLFLNPLPLRLDLSGDPDVRELVRRASRSSRAALAHSDLPFEQIVAAVNPERHAYRQPLFDVVINHHPPGAQPRLGELGVSFIRGLGAPVAPYELMVRTITRERGMAVQMDYQRDRHADDTVNRWLASYVAILRAFASEPPRRLSQLAGQ